MRGSPAGGAVAAMVAIALSVAGCSSEAGTSGPSIEDGGLPVYSVGAPEDLNPLDVATALHSALQLPDDADIFRRSDVEARIDGAGHTAVVQDRRAGTVTVSYSGPRFSNAGCVDCPLLDASDDVDDYIDASRAILQAVGVDTDAVVLSEGLHTDVEYRVDADVVIDGTVIGDLGFNFLWTDDLELSRLSGGLFLIETIGTVAPRSEADARAQAEEMIGADRTITDFELTATGAFRDGELIVAPAYLATTDLGTTFTVSGFVGDLPDEQSLASVVGS